MKEKIKLKLAKLAELDSVGRIRFMVSLEALLLSPVLPAKTIYWLSKIRAVVEPEVTAFEDARKSTVLRLGEAKPNGDVIISGARVDEFKKEMEPLNIDIELPISEPLKLPWDDKLGVGVDLTPLLPIIEPPQ
jgi:hypothetical protein